MPIGVDIFLSCKPHIRTSKFFGLWVAQHLDGFYVKFYAQAVSFQTNFNIYYFFETLKKINNSFLVKYLACIYKIKCQ